MSSLLVRIHHTRLAAVKTILLILFQKILTYPKILSHEVVNYLLCSVDANLKVDIRQCDDVTAFDGHRDVRQQVTLIQFGTVRGVFVDDAPA